jgi:hypothetical protein
MTGVVTHGNSTQLDKCGDNHVLRTKWGAPLFVPISRMPDKVILMGAVRQDHTIPIWCEGNITSGSIH